MQSLLDLQYARWRWFDNCDYFAVHRVGKKRNYFVANVLAHDETEALRVAKRQCFSNTKERSRIDRYASVQATL